MEILLTITYYGCSSITMLPSLLLSFCSETALPRPLNYCMYSTFTNYYIVYFLVFIRAIIHCMTYGLTRLPWIGLMK
jgi:hypothetical protein